MSKAVENQIKKIYNSVFQKVFTTERTNALAKGNRMEIESAVLKLASSEKYDEFAKKFSIELAKKGLGSQRGIWRKYFQAARQSRHIALPSTFNEFELQIMKKAVEKNYQMIKSIPNNLIEITNHKYTTTLIEEIAKGSKPRGSFKKLLEKHGASNAGVIARTEAAKLQTSIMENRSRDLGSIAYIWLSSNDRRTRASHKAMNGVVVFWRESQEEKPFLDNMYGNAGEFPNCRCSPEPIFDEADLTKSSYKLYNYRTKSIIQISKSELIKLIENEST